MKTQADRLCLSCFCLLPQKSRACVKISHSNVQVCASHQQLCLQVVSAVLAHFTCGQAQLTMNAGSKASAHCSSSCLPCMTRLQRNGQRSSSLGDCCAVNAAGKRGQEVWTACLRSVRRHGFGCFLPGLLVQVGADYWGKGSAELRVEMLSGYLCTGCLDKGQYGRHGLLHAVQASACCRELGQQKLHPAF